jgi:hypothetical protein
MAITTGSTLGNACSLDGIFVTGYDDAIQAKT